MQPNPREKIVTELQHDLKSIQKNDVKYVKKFNEARSERMQKRVIRKKLDKITDFVAPSSPVESKRHTKKERSEMAAKLHAEVKQATSQATFELYDEVKNELAEVTPISRINFSELLKGNVCENLNRLVKKWGGNLNREIMKYRIIHGCDVT